MTIRIKTKTLFFTLFAAFSLLAEGFQEDGLYPSSIILLDDYFSHHVLVVEKSTHKLYLFENNAGMAKHIKTFQTATGKINGNKLNEGDHKTPEGIYQLNGFHSQKDLISRFGKEGEIYGQGAFTTNYPNFIDKITNKSGNGIWLHSTNDESRIAKGLDSRGCVVVANNDLIEISKYIDLKNTSIVIVQDLNFHKEDTWTTNKTNIQSTIENWLTAWQEKNFNEYISFYHQREYRDSFRPSYHAFKNYKRNVFRAPGKPEIKLDHLSILQFNDYIVAQFQQSYRSNTIQDVGKKILYLKKDHDYRWKIVHEEWQKLEEQPQVAFSPSHRFFEQEKNNPN